MDVNGHFRKKDCRKPTSLPMGTTCFILGRKTTKVGLSLSYRKPTGLSPHLDSSYGLYGSKPLLYKWSCSPKNINFMPQVLQIGTPCIVIKHTKTIKEERERERERELVLLAALQTHAIQ